MKRIKQLVTVSVIALALGVVGCPKNPTQIDPDRCERMVDIAYALAEAATIAIDEEKIAKVRKYRAVVTTLGSLGCSFVPPPNAPAED